MKGNLVICLGNNNKNLKGSKNDALLFFNYIKSLIEKGNNDNFISPKILFNKDVTINNILKIINLNQKKYEIENLIIFFSGHSYENDFIDIFNENLKPTKRETLLDEINKILKYQIKLKIIYDSCFSGDLKNIFKKYEYLQKIKICNFKNFKIISSSKKNQNANETLCEINNFFTKFNIKYLKNEFIINKKTITLGVFTLNFVKILKEKNYCLTNWNLFLKNNYWNKLKEIVDQEPYVRW